jgi:hypothetical protein
VVVVEVVLVEVVVIVANCFLKGKIMRRKATYYLFLV